MMRALPIGIACVLAYAADAAVADDGLGRLFFTPAQRVQLDAARTQRDRRAPATPTTGSEQAVPQGPDVVTYNGVVRRSDGKSTVWINGNPITERSTSNSEINLLNVRRDGAVSIAVPQADRTASLKVGQSLEVTSGTIEESFARRATVPNATKSQAAAVTGTAAAKPTPEKTLHATRPPIQSGRERDERSSTNQNDAAAADSAPTK